jgi:F-type H+-transporting ATPase subunit a
MPESLAITRLLNAWFGPAVAALLNLVGVHPGDPAAPINDAFAVELLVTLGLIAFFVMVRLTLSSEKPNPAQQLAEMVNQFTGNLGDQIIGHGYQKYQAWVTVIFLFVLINSLTGLLPGVTEPTAYPYVPLGLAFPTFLYYNFQGVRANGVLGYAKQFAGPVWWMAWLIIPIELVSHLARIMSLTIRLYANMYASDMLTLGFFSLIPLGIPSIFLGLHAFVTCIQAFIFMLLSMIYLSLATAHEH